MADEEMTLEEQINQLDLEDPNYDEKLEKIIAGEPLETGTSAELETEKEKANNEAAKSESTETQAQATKQDDKAKAEGEASTTQQPEGIATKDNKHVIPYSVLEREREARMQAEEALKTYQQQIETLQAGTQTATEDDIPPITDEQLNALDDISPEVAAVIRSQMAMIAELQEAMNAKDAKMAAIEQEQNLSKRAREQEIDDQVNAAVSANTDLKAWQDAAMRQENPDTERWNTAAAFDASLRANPVWRDRPLDQRLAKVVELTKATYGEAQTKQSSETKSAAELQRIAEEKLKAKATETVPTSLSDIPGDSNIAQSDADLLENASVTDLAAKFANMTPEQQEAYIARLGV